MYKQQMCFKRNGFKDLFWKKWWFFFLYIYVYTERESFSGVNGKVQKNENNKGFYPSLSLWAVFYKNISIFLFQIWPGWFWASFFLSLHTNFKKNKLKSIFPKFLKIFLGVFPSDLLDREFSKDWTIKFQEYGMGLYRM